MTNLSPKAEQALQNLRILDADYRRRKAAIEQDLRETLNDLIAEARTERDLSLIHI